MARADKVRGTVRVDAADEKERERKELSKSARLEETPKRWMDRAAPSAGVGLDVYGMVPSSS
jgi:hypothetical protein